MKDREYYCHFTINEEERVEPILEAMIAYLLDEDYLFLNSRHYLSEDNKKEDLGETLVLFVNTNDILCWGCADASNITEKEIPEFFEMVRNDKYGVIKWYCKKMNMKPQYAWVKRLKEENKWEDWMELLKDNPTN